MVKVDAKLSDRILGSYRVTTGRGFRLGDHDPGDTHGFKSEQKGEARTLLARGIEWLAEEQEKLYAQDRWGVLLVFQAMDAAGKDSTIKHVMSGVNPQGVHVTSFKAPSSEELDHDFMWRCMKVLPERAGVKFIHRADESHHALGAARSDFRRRAQFAQGPTHVRFDGAGAARWPPVTRSG